MKIHPLIGVSFLSAAAIGAFAAQPNMERTTTCDVDGVAGSGNSLVSTVYNDGLGRGIQRKTALPSDTVGGTPRQKDRVESATFFDGAGRPRFTSKPFVDYLRPGEYLPGEITDNGAIDNDFEALLYEEQGSHHAFSKTFYREDPSGTVRASAGPGDTATYGMARSWVFGVSVSEPATVSVTNGSAVFSQGLVTALAFTAGRLPDVLEEVYGRFLSDNPFTAPDHLLSVSMTPDGRISEELKDLFGRTVATFSDPDTNGVTGLKISGRYSHDLLGNVLREIPPADTGGAKLVDDVEYSYNTLGQLVRKRTPDGGEFTYEYLDDGSLGLMTSLRNDTAVWGLRYFYDDLGRQTRIDEELFGFATNTGVVCNYYDGIGGLPWLIVSVVPEHVLAGLTNLKGRLVATVATNSCRKKTVCVGELFSYDDEGRIDRKYMLIQGSPLIQRTEYTYDLHGKLLTEDFHYAGDHVRKRYAYDQLGRLAKVYHCVPQAGGTFEERELLSNDYTGVGRLDSTTLSRIDGGAHAVSFGYDLRDRIVSSNVSPLLKGFTETVCYDGKSGNIATTACTYRPDPSHDSGVVTFSSRYAYDRVNRLTGATIECGAASEVCSYGYDPAGRFRSKREGASVVDGYRYYADPSAGYTNRLRSTSRNPLDDDAYVYDKRGNLVVDFTREMVIEYNWRDLPSAYRFYDDLADAGITRDARGTCTNVSLYKNMSDRVAAGTVRLISTVMMVYDSEGNRVCKMDLAE